MASLVILPEPYPSTSRPRLDDGLSVTAYFDGGLLVLTIPPQSNSASPGKAVNHDLYSSFTFTPHTPSSRGDSSLLSDCDRQPCIATPLHGDGSGIGRNATRTHDLKPAKCGVPPLSNELEGKPFDESAKAPNQEQCSWKGAVDDSAAR